MAAGVEAFDRAQAEARSHFDHAQALVERDSMNATAATAHAVIGIARLLDGFLSEMIGMAREEEELHDGH